jgi:hypothetical protein
MTVKNTVGTVAPMTGGKKWATYHFANAPVTVGIEFIGRPLGNGGIA